MEDTLSVYQRPYDWECPVVCMDEMPVQLLGEVRDRIQAQPVRVDPETELPKPGYIEKIDYEYARNGTASIFMFNEPPGGRRHAVALLHRTRVDWACMIRQLAEEFYPDAKRIVLVSDNLDTHALSSLYEAFPAHAALAIADRIEIHHTPPHGSWLNMAETELSALSMQCVGRKRTDNLEALNSMLQAWEQDRNAKQIGINWQFTAEDARIKLKRLYPEPVLTADGIMPAHGPPKNFDTVLEFTRH